MKPLFLLIKAVLSVPLLGEDSIPQPIEKDYFAVEKYFETVTNDTTNPPENGLAYEK